MCLNSLKSSVWSVGSKGYRSSLRKFSCDLHKTAIF